MAMTRDFKNLSRQVAIIGAAECDEIGVVPNKSSMQLLIEAAWNALDDAGVSKDEVDGLLSTTSTLQIAEYMGVKQPRLAAHPT
jgi:3-oxoacyl-[acyl-carrier-protein] synthase III